MIGYVVKEKNHGPMVEYFGQGHYDYYSNSAELENLIRPRNDEIYQYIRYERDPDPNNTGPMSVGRGTYSQIGRKNYLMALYQFNNSDILFNAMDKIKFAPNKNTLFYIQLSNQPD
ncbi:hypothetical protein MEO40_27785, partial [Dolichospermum sp. ST_sed1]|nr:hypothetical protein [Dolichospermum sp. ST_sed1]